MSGRERQSMFRGRETSERSPRGGRTSDAPDGPEGPSAATGGQLLPALRL